VAYERYIGRRGRPVATGRPVLPAFGNLYLWTRRSANETETASFPPVTTREQWEI